MGSIDHYLGLLASALGRNEVACQHFERALQSTIAPALNAQTEYLYGRTLAARREARDRARLLLSSARDQGQRFGLPQLRERADAALSAL
jgi:DNA primase